MNKYCEFNHIQLRRLLHNLLLYMVNENVLIETKNRKINFFQWPNIHIYIKIRISNIAIGKFFSLIKYRSNLVSHLKLFSI